MTLMLYDERRTTKDKEIQGRLAGAIALFYRLVITVRT